MYVTLLTTSLEEWDQTSERDEIVAHAVACRREMLLASPRRGDPTYRALAAQISYDRSLIKVCEVFGIATSVTNFSDPSAERRRLEEALIAEGLDLAEKSRATL